MDTLLTWMDVTGSQWECRILFDFWKRKILATHLLIIHIKSVSFWGLWRYYDRVLSETFSAGVGITLFLKVCLSKPRIFTFRQPRGLSVSNTLSFKTVDHFGLCVSPPWKNGFKPKAYLGGSLMFQNDCRFSGTHDIQNGNNWSQPNRDPSSNGIGALSGKPLF